MEEVGTQLVLIQSRLSRMALAYLVIANDFHNQIALTIHQWPQLA